MKVTLASIACLVPALTTASLLRRQDTTFACNNSPDLCSRSYSSITHLGAHDSPFLRDGGASQSSITFSDSGNQNINSTSQLTAGVRLLTAQVHKFENALRLCHSNCNLLDAGPLRTWLLEIKSWLDTHPHEVVTLLLVNADSSSAFELSSEFTAAGIASYGYIPPAPSTPPTAWPTLGDMIANNTRLVTFIAPLPSPAANTAAPYLLDEFTFVFENDYNNTTPSSFSCVPDRPPTLLGQTQAALTSNRLPLVNHFLYSTSIGFGIQTPDLEKINTTNAASGAGSLGEAATKCTSEYGGRQPWGLLVDYFDQGETLKVVDGLNGVTEPVGRGDVAELVQAAMSTGKGGKVQVPSLLGIGGVLGVAMAVKEVMG